jgi:hypothetical protein
MKSAATRVVNNLPKVMRAMNQLALNSAYVGVTSDHTERSDTDDENKGPMTNAALAFIHDQGSPAAGIPQREFMRPGVREAQPYIVDALRAGALGTLHGSDPLQSLKLAGMKAQTEIRKKINDGIPPPLADSTLRQRIRNRTSIKGAVKELQSRASGNAPTLANAKPLIATAQLRNSITYVIRKS